MYSIYYTIKRISDVAFRMSTSTVALQFLKKNLKSLKITYYAFQYEQFESFRGIICKMNIFYLFIFYFLD